jgi:hypothetical protein
MAKPDEVEYYKQEDLLKISHHPPAGEDWMGTAPDFRPGSWIYPGNPKHL